ASSSARAARTATVTRRCCMAIWPARVVVLCIVGVTSFLYGRVCRTGGRVRRTWRRPRPRSCPNDSGQDGLEAVCRTSGTARCRSRVSTLPLLDEPHHLVERLGDDVEVLRPDQPHEGLPGVVPILLDRDDGGAAQVED